MTDMTKQTEAISTERALKLALEAFETLTQYNMVRANIFRRFEPTCTGDYVDLKEFREKAEPAITALREALAEQPAQQEPVAWMYPDDYERMTTSETFCTVYSVEVGSATRGESTVALYTSPPTQRTWVGLTDEEVRKTINDVNPRNSFIVASAIEAKLKEKNT